MKVIRDNSPENILTQFKKVQRGFTLMNQIEFVEKIGSGAFGDVWHVIDQLKNESLACKVETKSNLLQIQKVLQKEIKFILELQAVQGIPNLRIYGSDIQNNYMVIELLGQNLEQLKVKQMLTKSQVLTIGIKVIKILQEIHKNGILHRDIKPENIMTGKDNLDDIYIVDFGLAKRYIIDGHHVPFNKNKGLVGTARYSSFRALAGINSCRDDLESLFYTLIYLLKGTLPWSNTNVENKLERYRMIRILKENLQPEETWRDIPKCLQTFFYYIRNLDFDEVPNYQNMIKIFNKDIQDQSNDDWNKTTKYKTIVGSLLQKYDTLSPNYQSITNLRSDYIPKSGFGSSQKCTPNQSKYNNFDSCSFLSCDIDEFGEEELEKVQIAFPTEGIKRPSALNLFSNISNLMAVPSTNFSRLS